MAELEFKTTEFIPFTQFNEELGIHRSKPLLFVVDGEYKLGYYQILQGVDYKHSSEPKWCLRDSYESMDGKVQLWAELPVMTNLL